MTSVGIMSMQRILNYGSTLQAHALAQLIRRADAEARVGFIDFEPGPPLVQAEAGKASRGGRVARTISKLREYNDVDASLANKFKFANHKRTYAAKYFPLVGIGASTNRDLDLQVIGSDEVFNCVQANSNVGFSKDLFGYNSRANRVISYAASFGNTTLEKIDAAGIRSELVEGFAKFHAISVRDENSRRIVEELSGQAPSLHLDPTLVYDFGSAPPEVPRARQHDEPYVVVYGYSGRFSRGENDRVRTLAAKLGARVLAFGGLQGCADEFVDCDPFTLLAYFRDAEAVVTDTFHGTIFSIINETPFVSLVRTSSGHGYGNEEKLGYLLDLLGLSDRAVRANGDLVEVVEAPIDFTAARATRSKESARSVDYLSRALEL